jgi:hypothetical protein
MASVLWAVSAGGIMIGVIGGSDGVLGSGVLHAALKRTRTTQCRNGERRMEFP